MESLWDHMEWEVAQLSPAFYKSTLKSFGTPWTFSHWLNTTEWPLINHILRIVQLSPVRIPDPENSEKWKWCFKPWSLGVVCCAAIDNQNRWQNVSSWVPAMADFGSCLSYSVEQNFQAVSGLSREVCWLISNVCLGCVWLEGGSKKAASPRYSSG